MPDWEFVMAAGLPDALRRGESNIGDIWRLSARRTVLCSTIAGIPVDVVRASTGSVGTTHFDKTALFASLPLDEAVQAASELALLLDYEVVFAGAAAKRMAAQQWPT